ncbi:MAG: MBL fold metallo-hydrolase, partial [Xanthobacteraceae bacterium]
VSTAHWLAALSEVEKLQPKFIIPGHGKASTKAAEAIAFTRDYIQYVRAAMTKAVQDWVDFDAAYDQTDWSKYKDMPAFANNNRGNAYRIYLELEQSQFNSDKK